MMSGIFICVYAKSSENTSGNMFSCDSSWSSFSIAARCALSLLYRDVKQDL